MLEGVVARLLNRWLGNYVLDLDTENLNVGIFSGHVQLTDLRLKPEALYELDLPIHIILGTIGKISIQIPWNALLNQSVVIHIEDVHILAGPVITNTPFDPDKEKRLTRAAKRKTLSDLYSDGELIGGPELFSEHLISNIINNFQVVIQNVHIRYEDRISIPDKALAAGICISSITAETTNNKWKASNTPKGCPTGYHLLKIESFSVYWNHLCETKIWDWKTQYYLWRNAMTNSLQTFSMNGVDFDFLIKPMTCKIKFIINKTNGAQTLKLLVDMVLQDFTIQISREQYLSINSVIESLNRMRTSRYFLYIRPMKPTSITKSTASVWWKYAHEAILEQRIRPYTWSRIAKVRANYRLYRDVYKKVLVNPNDTELKLDLQKYEDNLSLINIVIAREHAKLMLEQEQPEFENSPLEKCRNLWSMLPSPERSHLCQLIGFIDNDTHATCHYIEHKYNITISNFSLSLLYDNKEVFVATLTQVLASAETQSTGNFVGWNKFLKFSARAEGFVIEGASLEDHLVPLISAQHHCSNGSSSITQNVFSMDYESNPAGANANCKLWCSLEAIEITFHTFAIGELLKFFDNTTTLTNIPANLGSYKKFVTDSIKKLLSCVLTNRVDLNLDIKIPYFIIPEYGSTNKSGNILIIDFGRMVIRTELTQSLENLEEATQMELEERAYSRVHIDLFHAQVLFCDSSENWRDARKETDTDMHLISKINTLIVFALCTNPDHKSLPKHKLNITVPSFKINISERKIGLFLTYLEHLEQVSMSHYNKFKPICMETEPQWRRHDTIVVNWQLDYLKRIRKAVSQIRIGMKVSLGVNASDMRRASDLSAITDRSVEPSDYSEESVEAWARCVDLPGLEDNVSPHNNIKNLLRIVIGEVCFVLSRSSERIDRPYLMFRVGKCCLDLANMDYGPALQLTIASISLTDKLHTNITGQYLDLIHVPVPSEQDFLMILYRKVRADCPDFRSHFHSVEKSLVADFGPVNFLIHRDAIRALVKYGQYLYNKMNKHESNIINFMYKKIINTYEGMVHPSGNVIDPPVPAGAVKFSHSARATMVTARLCDADRDLFEIRIGGLECDFMFRANERLVLRAYLSSLHVDHLTDVTLYTKVLTSDEEKVFEIKYVRHAPRLYTSNAAVDIAASSLQDDVNSDGSVRVNIGRLQITLLYKLILQLKHFSRPLLESKGHRLAVAWLKGTCEKTLRSSAKIHLAINVHGPTLLLPQKTASPNLIVIHTGELTVENFFKESPPTKSLVIENILVKLEGTTIFRAVMTLASNLEMQEAILEPMSIRLDIKRMLNTTGANTYNAATMTRAPSWEIDGILDVIKFTLGQRDLTTLLAVYTDNINEGHFVEFSPDLGNCSIEMNQLYSPPPLNNDDQAVKCLQAFLCQVESKHKDVCVKINVEGILLSLFCDCDEVLSSPVRDLNHGLCRLEIGDTLFSSDLYTDSSLEAKLSIQGVTVVDIRPDINSCNNIIFQSHRDETKANTYQISVSTPPVIDVSFHQNNMGDKFIDVIIERICLTLSVPFLATLGRFVFESMPCDRRHEGGIVNHGYIADTNTTNEEQNQNITPQQVTEHDPDEFQETNTPGLTIAIRMCKPECILLSDAQLEKGNIFIIKAEILVDYSRHALRENLIISLSNLHVLFNAMHHSEPYILLHPCDFEFSKNFKIEDGIKSTLTVSSLQIHFCAAICLTCTDILEDIYLHLNATVVDVKPKQYLPYMNRSQEKCDDDLEDLWSPKRLSQCYVTEQELMMRDLNVDNDETLILNNHLEMFIGSISNITIVFELEGAGNGTTSTNSSNVVPAISTQPIILVQASFETTIHDWSRQLHGTVEFHLQANYYNEQIESWEPLIEPIACTEGSYRPWECFIKIFQSSATPMNDNFSQQKDTATRVTARSNSSSGDEDTSSDGGMVFLRPQNANVGDKATPRIQTSLAAFLEDTDSETEDGTMEKLASAICDLFTGDWNESEDSDCGHSSETDESGGSESDHHKRKTRSGSTGLFTDQLVTFVLIDSRDTLNISLTSQTIQLLHDVIIAYTDRTAIASSVICSTGKTISLINDIGPKSKVELIKKSEQDNIVLCSKTFEKVDSGPSSPAKSVEDLSAEESINSICSDVRAYPTEIDWQQDKDMLQSLFFPEITTSTIYKMVNEEQICVQVPGFSPLYASCPRRTWQKLLRLQPMLHNTKYHLVAKQDVNRAGRNLIVRSPLQLCNETCYPIGVFYEKSILSEMGLETVGEIMNPFEDTVRVTVLEPHDIYNVPLHIAYHCKLFLQPAYTECHQLSNIGLWWPELLTELNTARDIYCEPKMPENNGSNVFSLRIQMKEQDLNESLSRQQTRTIPNYLIRLLPPFIVHNCLPYSIEIKIPNSDQQIHVDAGDKTTLYTLNMQKNVKFIVELNYLGLLWTSSLNLTTDLDEKALSMVTDFDTEGGNKQLTINVRVDRTNSRELFFYSPYWVVNKTGLPLQIKGSVSNIVYDSQGEETLLFSYKRQARQTVRIRAYQSSWSAEFSLDAVGSSGLVIARDKERNRRYPVLLSITLSKMCPRFTKIITLLPNFLVHNNTKKHLRFMEENESTDLWLDLTPGQCVPFWPETQSMQMYVKYRDSKVVSQNFSIATVHQIVLRMDKGSAVSVQVSGGRTEPFCIKFTGYRVGDAPCRVDNMCSDLHLKVNQHNQGQVTLISPQHSLLYTWDDPCAERILVWNVYNNKGIGFPLDIRTDGYGEVRIRLHTVKPGTIVPSPPAAVQASSTAAAVSSSSDSDSSSEEQQTSAQLTKKSMRRDKVVVYWLCYMDGPQRTVMFTQDHRLATQYRRRAHFDYCEWEICLSLSGIGVSMCLLQPSKPLEFAYFALTDSPALWEVNIAHKWKMLTLELAAWVEDKYKTQQKKCQLKDYVFIDFEKMYMLKPFYGELRRTYYPALWLQYRKSEINQFYRLKVNSLQVESEPQENQQFKILYPLTSHLPKPFGVSCIEFSCFKRHYPLHEYDTYKFITLDMQEFCANINKLFIERLYQMFHVWIAPNDPGMNIRQDMALVHISLTSLVQQCSNTKKKTIIERLRFTPIQIQLNISTTNTPNNTLELNNKVCDTFKYIFNSLDLSYIPLKQAKYNLTTFELENISTNVDQLYLDIWNHYKTQFLQQFHVHVLGQEVLLNPYGVNALIQNTTTHNNETDLSMAGAEVERTCRCLLGHVHGSQSLLTAILGRDYPFIHSLDTEYKRRKKYGPPHIINTFPETLGAVSRTFLIGVTLGFCGVSHTSNIGVTSQFNGVESFFRGNGKALASLMTRGGVSDCVDVANDAIRRAVLMGERINIRNRLHRYIHAQMSLKPFSLYESMGQNLLMMISNGRFAKTNTYWAHAPLNNTGKLLLLITLEQIFLVENCRQWSTWDIEWSIDLDDIVSVPKIIGNEIIINIRQDDLKQQANSVEKYVVQGQPDILAWLKEKIEQAIVISMENKCWTSINEH